ncbi:MAG: hypothetical protein LBT33_04430 [Spirochaetia bacterium]|jgi:hypothetical protein|nr:hypothetical protein [Spirochaetia bacterium]
MPISEERRRLLAEDLGLIRSARKNFRYFNLAGNLSVLMTQKGVADGELARRMGIPNTNVSNWRFGKAYPKNREQFKEIGLCLCMGEGELNYFLVSMGYPPLYPKNSFDGACIAALHGSSGAEGVIAAYRESVGKLNGARAGLGQVQGPILGADGEANPDLVRSEEEFEKWLARYAAGFSSLARTVLPNKELILYATLFLGGAMLGEMYQTGELPPAIRSLLDPMEAGKEFFPKELRNKLIAFGLSKNMNDADIDRILELGRLRLFSSPETPVEAALLMAVRRAHIRFPVYEYRYLCDMSALLGAILRKPASGSQDLKESTIWRLSFYSQLADEISERLETAGLLSGNYFSAGLRDDVDREFEKYYTALSGEGEKHLADYVGDIIAVLAEDGDFPEKDVGDAREMLGQG